jgi:hypothetical protein
MSSREDLLWRQRTIADLTAAQLASHNPYLNIGQSAIAIDTGDERSGPGRWIDLASRQFPTYQNCFENASAATPSFVNGTRTFTISGTFSYFSNGRKYTSTGASIVIPDTEGLHHIYFDGATLTSTTTFDFVIITTYAYVAAVYWDATNDTAIIVANERHGAEMDSATHSYLHSTVGAAFESGLSLGDIIAGGNGNLATHAQLSVAAGAFRDEDIRHAIAAMPLPAQIPLYYRSGATGAWRRIAPTAYPVTTTGTVAGRATYNNENAGGAGIWGLSEVLNDDYVLTHIYATNDPNNPIIGIIGQATYLNTNAAEVGAEVEALNLKFGTIASLVPEFLLIATVIFQSQNNNANAVKSHIVATASGANYIDWRKKILGSGA